MRPTFVAALSLCLVAGSAALLAATGAPRMNVDLSWGVNGRGQPLSVAGGDVLDSQGRTLRAITSMSVPNDFDAGVVRLGLDGELDPTFADAGVFRLTPPPDDSSEMAIAAGIAEDGSLLLLTGAAPPVSYSPVTLRLTRLTEDGVLDTTYGDGGTAVLASGLDMWSGGRGGPMLVRPQGDAFVFVVDPSKSEPVALLHVSADGHPDPAFAGSGAADLPLSPRISEGLALAFDGSGRILVAGVEPTTDGIADELRLVRLTAVGQRDASFGTHGVVPVPAGMSAYLASVFVAATPADGGLYVVAGGAWRNSRSASAFVAAVRADSPGAATRLSEAALAGGAPLSVSGLETQTDGRVLASFIQLTPDLGATTDAFTLRLRFDGEDGGPAVPPPPPPPLRGPVVTAAWTKVDRLLNSRERPTPRLACVLRVANVGDQPSTARQVRVLLSRDELPDVRDQRLALIDIPALPAGSVSDVPLSLKVMRRDRVRNLLVVFADDPTHMLGIFRQVP